MERAWVKGKGKALMWGEGGEGLLGGHVWGCRELVRKRTHRHYWLCVELGVLPVARPLADTPEEAPFGVGPGGK